MKPGALLLRAARGKRQRLCRLPRKPRASRLSQRGLGKGLG